MSAQAENQRSGTRSLIDRLISVAVTLGVFAKFFAFFVSFAAYSFWFGSWQFGLGFVLLILVHELGHFLEARRQRVPVTLPTFVPFIGAFVTTRQAGLAPWRSALISLAGPFVGGLGAAAVWAVGSARDTTWLVVLANIGFLLNAFNLLPIGFLDGGTISQCISRSRRGWIRYENGVPVEAYAPERTRAVQIAVSYVVVAVALIVCYFATRNAGAF